MSRTNAYSVATPLHKLREVAVLFKLRLASLVVVSALLGYLMGVPVGGFTWMGILGLAVAWAHSLNVPLTLVGVVAETSPGPHTGEIEYLEGHTADLRRYVTDTSFELLSSSDPVTGLAEFMRTREGAVLCMSTHGRTGGRGLIGNVALGVVGANPRPTVLARPGI